MPRADRPNQPPRIKQLPLILIGMLAMFPAAAGAAGFDFSGYYKAFLMVFQSPAAARTAAPPPPEGAANNRLRLKLGCAFSAAARLDAAWDLSPRLLGPSLSQTAGNPAALLPPAYRCIDWNNRLYPGPSTPVSNFAVFHNLDRLALTIKTSIADIFIGRQAIAWGAAHVINPTDIIAPCAFNELDAEERRGVDALRVRVPLGEMDELDIGYIAGKHFRFSQSAAYVRGKTRVWNTEVALLAMTFRENVMIGLDLARSLGGAGCWLEAAWTSPAALSGEKNNGGTERKEPPWLRLSIGVDYNFRFGLYGFLEYHYSSAGSASPSQYPALLNRAPHRDGAVYLTGRHYLAGGASAQVSPLVALTGFALWNAGDGSLSLSVSGEYNIAENIYLGLGAWTGAGAKPQNGVPASEFGAYPHLFFSSFRICF